jgi:hypothetical protein
VECFFPTAITWIAIGSRGIETETALALISDVLAEVHGNRFKTCGFLKWFRPERHTDIHVEHKIWQALIQAD